MLKKRIKTGILRQIIHMRKCGRNIAFFEKCEGEIFECEACGNHVCKECAAIWNGVCPHCFSRLLRIS